MQMLAVGMVLFLPSSPKLGQSLQIKDDSTCQYEQKILTSSILLAFDASVNDYIGRKAVHSGHSA